MRSSSSLRGSAGAVVLVATLAFGAALGLRGVVSVWPAIGVAAVVSIGLVGRRIPRWFSARWGMVAAGVVAGLAMAVATHGVYSVVTGWFPSLVPQVGELYADLRAAPGPVWGAAFLLLAVVAEELVWRGVLVDQLRRRMGPAALVLVASVLYALPQVASRSWILVATALGCGVVWTAMRRWSGDLVLPLTTHVVWDLAVFVIWPLQ